MMTTRIAYGAAYARPSFSARLGDVLSAALATSRLWMRRRHDRHALSQLDTHMLRDIGFDRAQADEMAARPFWRA
ncbi:MAG: hypothetical protein C0484_20195 [Rhodospirillum sp.]|jgi:uncharacterized protein YjiS (DUF1127 family)|nr:hypothetical protein [Rhodospirillum sp.]